MKEKTQVLCIAKGDMYVYNIYIVMRVCCEVPRFISVTRD